MEDLLRKVEEQIAICRKSAAALPELEKFASKLRVLMSEEPQTTQSLVKPCDHRASVDSEITHPVLPTSAQNHVTDLAHASIKAAARHILSERGNAWTSYQELARLAYERGYRSEAYGDDIRKTALSFRDMMRRDEKSFDRNQQLFRMKPGAEKDIESKKRKTGNPEGKTLGDCIAQVIREQGGRPMKTTEIMEALQSTGLWIPSNEKTFYGAIYSACVRLKNEFERDSESRWKVRANTEASNGTPRFSRSREATSI